MALGQCRKAIRALKLKPVTEADTGRRRQAFARHAGPHPRRDRLGARRRGLRAEDGQVWHRGREAQHHALRGACLKARARQGEGRSRHHHVRVPGAHVPAALYKALGGFATNGVNMTKLESYQLEGSFNATMFYADIEGHPDERLVKLAMEELAFFTSEARLLGTYKASPFRAELKG